jgi:hypothetical protein
MDDGARTIRFTPYFANSGFYFLKNNNNTQQLMERMLKSATELSSTHSHQCTLTRYLTEMQHLCNLDIEILDEEAFPSGNQYHNDKPFLKRIFAGIQRPFVFHMSFTATRDDKVRFFKDIQMWSLPARPECNSASAMADWIQQRSDNKIIEACCSAIFSTASKP